MGVKDDLDKQLLVFQNEYKNLKEQLKQHFLLKEFLPNIIEFNEQIEQYIHYFLDEKNDEQTLVHFRLYKSIFNLNNYNSIKAANHLKEASVFSKTMNRPVYRSFHFNIKSSICWLDMDYENAVKYAFKALKCLDKITTKNSTVILQIGRIQANLSNIFFEVHKYKKSFKYYHKAISIFQNYNHIEQMAHSMSNFILDNIELENYNLVKKEKARFDKIVLTTNSNVVHAFYATVELNCAFFFNKPIKEIEILLLKHEKRLANSTNLRDRLNYLIAYIEILIKKNEFEQVFKQCELLYKNFGKVNQAIYYLLNYLSWICVKNPKYIKSIILSEILSKLNINGDIVQLLQLFFAESKNHNKAVQISTYNFIIEYYQKEGNYKKAFEYSSECLSQLKDFSFENVHHEFETTFDQLESEQKIEQQNDLLVQQEKLTQYFKEFAYTAAHDLKSPLITIKKFAEIIIASYNNVDTQKAQEYLSIIVETSEKMEGFIKEMIEQYNKKRYQKKLEILDLNEVIDSVKQNLSISIEQSNFEIICRYNISKVYALKIPLEILFQNFISNAIKYRRKYVKSFVEINYTKDGVFSISDNGIGIEKKMCDKIFKPFFQCNEKHIGSGIGLATCKKIIDNFGGEVWVESELGKGSTFYFTILSKTSK